MEQSEAEGIDGFSQISNSDKIAVNTMFHKKRALESKNPRRWQTLIPHKFSVIFVSIVSGPAQHRKEWCPTE